MSISSGTLLSVVTTALTKQDQYNEQKYAQLTDVASAFHYKGTVTDFASLPITGNQVGDVYNIQTYTTATDINGDEVLAGDNVAYTGTGWDFLAGTVDFSNYYTKAEVQAQIDNADETISDADIFAAVAAANPGIQLGTNAGA